MFKVTDLASLEACVKLFFFTFDGSYCFMLFQGNQINWYTMYPRGAWWLSGRVLNLGSKGRWFKTQRMHCTVSLSKTLYPLLSKYDSTQEARKLFWHDWKMFDWGITKTNKQNNIIQPVCLYREREIRGQIKKFSTVPSKLILLKLYSILL